MIKRIFGARLRGMILVGLSLMIMAVFGYLNQLWIFDNLWLRGQFTKSEIHFFERSQTKYRNCFVEKLRNYGPRRNAIIVIVAWMPDPESQTELDIEMLEFIEDIETAVPRYVIMKVGAYRFTDRHLDQLIKLRRLDELYFCMENHVSPECIQRFIRARPDVNFNGFQPGGRLYPWESPDD